MTTSSEERAHAARQLADESSAADSEVPVTTRALTRRRYDVYAPATAVDDETSGAHAGEGRAGPAVTDVPDWAKQFFSPDELRGAAWRPPPWS